MCNQMESWNQKGDRTGSIFLLQFPLPYGTKRGKGENGKRVPWREPFGDVDKEKKWEENWRKVENWVLIGSTDQSMTAITIKQSLWRSALSPVINLHSIESHWKPLQTAAGSSSASQMTWHLCFNVHQCTHCVWHHACTKWFVHWLSHASEEWLKDKKFYLFGFLLCLKGNKNLKRVEKKLFREFIEEKCSCTKWLNSTKVLEKLCFCLCHDPFFAGTQDSCCCHGCWEHLGFVFVC